MDSKKMIMNLFKIAIKQQAIIKRLAQQSSQSGDIETALKKAGLWELSNEVAPLLDIANVPKDASVDIKINVGGGLIVSFISLVSPGDNTGKIGQSLSKLINKKFSAKMSAALKEAGISVTENMIINWLKF